VKAMSGVAEFARDRHFEPQISAGKLNNATVPTKPADVLTRIHQRSSQP
jgi:hypothetical protein